MEGKSRFTQEEIKEFRAKLLAKKRAILRLEDEREDQAFDQLSADGTGDITHVRLHPADTGSDTFEQELELQLAEGELRELQDIEDALEKLDKGTYGYCKECEDDIPKERLLATPEAKFCLECQREFEQEARRNGHLLTRRPDHLYRTM